MRALHTLLEELYEKANLSEDEVAEYRQRVGIELMAWAIEMREDISGEVSEFSVSRGYRELAEKPGGSE